jgi:hypothetical protein
MTNIIYAHPLTDNCVALPVLPADKLLAIRNFKFVNEPDKSPRDAGICLSGLSVERSDTSLISDVLDIARPTDYIYLLSTYTIHLPSCDERRQSNIDIVIGVDRPLAFGVLRRLALRPAAEVAPRNPTIMMIERTVYDNIPFNASMLL